MWRCGTELLETNYRISFLSGPDTWMIGWCHSVGRQIVEVTKPNRNTENIEVAVVNGNLCGGKMCDMCTLLNYAKKCGSMRNVQQSHIRIKLTCLMRVTSDHPPSDLCFQRIYFLARTVALK